MSQVPSYPVPRALSDLLSHDGLALIEQAQSGSTAESIHTLRNLLGRVYAQGIVDARLDAKDDAFIEACLQNK